MNFFTRIQSAAKAFVVIVAVTFAFSSLMGCSSMQGVDLLTWSKDAKAEGAQKYNDGKYADAAGCFRNAIRQVPNDPESYYWLGLCYEQTQSYHEAMDAYKTSLELMPAPNTVHYSQSMHDSAFDRLVTLVRRTSGDERTSVRTRLIELFELFDPADPEVVAGRRNLANALY